MPGNLLSDEEVEKWLNRRIPAVLAQTRKDNILSKLEHRFGLWVTGELTAETKSMIEAAQTLADLKGHSIRVLNAADIDQQVGLVKDPSLRKVVDQHFLRAPVRIAKNYLLEGEIDELNRIVTMWLDFAEDQSKRRKAVFLKDWEIKLDDFLRFNDREVLSNAGSRSHKQAVAHAEAEYEHFAEQRRMLLETEGEAHNLQMLQDATKVLPKQGRKGRK